MHRTDSRLARWTFWTVIAPALLATLAGLAGQVLGQSREEPAKARPYPIVDTAQRHVFSDTGQLRRAPRAGEPFFGQDAHYQGHAPRYRDNGDGTVSDLVTGLMWLKAPYTGEKLTLAQARRAASRCNTGAHDDWRLPTIKELYSLIDFNGDARAADPRPYIDTDYFQFTWGRDAKGERQIDSQYVSATEYCGPLELGPGGKGVFGVNFADGRIKCYPQTSPRKGGGKTFWVLYCRGNRAYGRNRFVDNGDGTVSDLATGLMWAKADSGKAMNWKDALAWAEKLELAGQDDWRLPNAKELQSIVDYTRAPKADDRSKRSAAIDPVFDITTPESYFWTSTTHLEGGRRMGSAGVYVAFGRAMGNMTDRRTGDRRWMDVHGAGAQRSDPKSGDPESAHYRNGRGPQGDDVRIYNYVRAVRNIDPGEVTPGEIRTDALPEHASGGPERFGDPGSGGESRRWSDTDRPESSGERDRRRPDGSAPDGDRRGHRPRPPRGHRPPPPPRPR